MAWIANNVYIKCNKDKVEEKIKDYCKSKNITPTITCKQEKRSRKDVTFYEIGSTCKIALYEDDKPDEVIIKDKIYSNGTGALSVDDIFVELAKEIFHDSNVIIDDNSNRLTLLNADIKDYYSIDSNYNEETTPNRMSLVCVPTLIKDKVLGIEADKIDEDEVYEVEHTFKSIRQDLPAVNESYLTMLGNMKNELGEVGIEDKINALCLTVMECKEMGIVNSKQLKDIIYSGANMGATNSEVLKLYNMLF